MNKLFKNYRTREFSQLGTEHQYSLVKATKVETSDQHLDRVTAICNEPEIFNWLFKKSCPDGKYKREGALGFLNWAHRGWEKGEYFVFFMLTKEKEIAGCIDIKENNLTKSEIGYWVSRYHKGLATPAVEILCQEAKETGYQKLFAGLKPDNIRSEQVLIKNKFLLDNDEINDSSYAKAYSKIL